jgi:hypothetical protein
VAPGKAHGGRRSAWRQLEPDPIWRTSRGRRFRVTTTSGYKHPIAPNLLARRSAPADVSGTDRVYASDITYIEPWKDGSASP